jgi:PHD/YefM family antitoxin component YafN of YafNO toxin-antitoxin module
MILPSPPIAELSPARQSIILINMSDWRRLSEADQVKEKSLVPRRTGSENIDQDSEDLDTSDETSCTQADCRSQM